MHKMNRLPNYLLDNSFFYQFVIFSIITQKNIFHNV